jgi:hypothetical protein
MGTMRCAILLLLAGVLTVLTWTPSVSAENRVALVVGNSAYRNVPRLENPANDARLMAEALRALGFTLVGGSAQVDLDKADFDNAVQTFGNQLSGADVGLFYYAGHGVQVRGANYLVPISANPTKEADVDFQMLDANLVLRQMESAGTKLNIIILDACRNNPFGGRGLRATNSGLAQMQATEGTLISFATQPGNVAQDGTNAHSPYTEALAQTIRRSGLDIFQTFNEVGLAVKRTTGGLQQPWVSSSPIAGSFYFAGAPAAVPPKPLADQSTPGPDPALEAWNAAKDTDSVEVLEAFITEFDSSFYAELAKAKLAELKRKKEETKVAVGIVPPPEAPPDYKPGEPPLSGVPKNELGRTLSGGEFSCSLEHSLKSLTGDHSVTVTFQNLSSEAISTYWLDYTGKRVFYQRINGGDSYTQQTYISHPWVLVDATGQCRKIILPGTSQKVVTIH